MTILYSSAQRKRIIRNIFKHLNKIEKLKIKVEKRSGLKSSAVLLSLKTKITGCTKTHQQNISKFAKETSKKNEMKYGNMKLPKSNDNNKSADQ